MDTLKVVEMDVLIHTLRRFGTGGRQHSTSIPFSGYCRSFPWLRCRSDNRAGHELQNETLLSQIEVCLECVLRSRQRTCHITSDSMTRHISPAKVEHGT